MSKEDILLLHKILHNENVETEELNKLTEKIDLIVKQIETQELLNDIALKISEMNKEA